MVFSCRRISHGCTSNVRSIGLAPEYKGSSTGSWLRVRWLLVAYAVLNALLYSRLLPLWEGFDEPFHFGYTQQLANLQGWPDPRITRVSAEIGSSLLLAPESYPVRLNLPQTPAFADYYRLPLAARADIRRRLWQIPTNLRRQPGEFMNYEALQPPLAYMLMALPERMLSRTPLPERVAILRFLVAIASSLALIAGAGALFRRLQIPFWYAASAIFCMLSCQMLWATVAHVANDWLAVPLSVWLLLLLIQYYDSPGRGFAGITAGVLGAALLTKAYFLVTAPLLPALCAWRRRWLDLVVVAVVLCAIAGPWHARNLRNYGDLTGTMETQSVGLHKALRTASSMPWLTVAASGLRRALWTGNNSFIAYSATTLNVLIAMMLSGWTLWAFSPHARAERIVFAYCALFGLVLAYTAITAWLATDGMVKGSQPWYWQVIISPLFGLCFLGASRRPAIGRFLTCALVLLSGYVLAATYIIKLIPWYGGYDGRGTLRTIAALYLQRWSELLSNLNSVSLASASAILLLAAAVVLIGLLIEIALLRAIWDAQFHRHGRE
jgi:hypothetical protein